MRIILVRHGETDYNIESRIMGWQPIPLNAKGEAQVSKLAGFLKNNYSILKIYSSDLLRTKNSVEIIGKRLGITEINYKHGLREHNFGEWEGMLFKDLQLNKNFSKYFELRNEDIRPPNGESINLFTKRVIPEFNSIVLDNSKTDSDVLVMAHGGTNRLIIGNILSMPFYKTQQLIRQDNACSNEIEYNSSTNAFRIQNLNVSYFLK